MLFGYGMHQSARTVVNIWFDWGNGFRWYGYGAVQGVHSVPVCGVES